MKSIGFIVVDAEDGIIVDLIGCDERTQKDIVEMFNSNPRTLGRDNKLPFRIVEAFING